VTGVGFPARARGSVRLAWSVRAAVRADARGRFAASLPPPDRARRGPRVLVVQVGRRHLRTTVALVRVPRGPSTLTVLSSRHRVIVRPSSGLAGAPLSATGTHFRARRRFSVRLGGRGHSRRAGWAGAGASPSR